MMPKGMYIPLSRPGPDPPNQIGATLDEQLRRATTPREPNHSPHSHDAACADLAAERIKGRGDAYELPPAALSVLLRARHGQHVEKRDAPRPRFNLLDSATFAQTDYHQEWLVQRLFVRSLPAVVGAPKKSMKTSIMVDLSISLATAEPFLNEFQVYRPNRVALFSGESGEATLQETMQRVANSKGIDAEQALDGLLWGFDLPRFADDQDMNLFQSVLAEHRIEVVVVDPAYLCVLAGAGPGGLQASNAMQMGLLYQRFGHACRSAGATPILVTHFRITRRENAFDQPDMDDLAYAGLQEWARQWLLLSRRERYMPGTGQHRLWLSVGGSAGQGGAWSLDIDEGVIDDDFRGRYWSVSVSTATEQIQTQKSAAEQKRQAKAREQDDADENAIMATVDRLAQEGNGVAGYTQIIELRPPGVSKERARRAIDRLKTKRLLQEASYSYASGTNGKVEHTGKGLRRPPEKEDNEVPEAASDDWPSENSTDRQTVSPDGQTDPDD
jgi:replicative DNA helicase